MIICTHIYLNLYSTMFFLLWSNKTHNITFRLYKNLRQWYNIITINWIDKISYIYFKNNNKTTRALPMAKSLFFTPSMIILYRILKSYALYSLIYDNGGSNFITLIFYATCCLIYLTKFSFRHRMKSINGITIRIVNRKIIDKIFMML